MESSMLKGKSQLNKNQRSKSPKFQITKLETSKRNNMTLKRN